MEEKKSRKTSTSNTTSIDLTNQPDEAQTHTTWYTELQTQEYLNDVTVNDVIKKIVQHSADSGYIPSY